MEVGVEQADLEAALRERQRQVHGHHALAHAALPAHHRDHALDRREALGHAAARRGDLLQLEGIPDTRGCGAGSGGRH